MKKKCDVLVMIWGMIGRDAEALIPIIYLLREKYNLAVEVRSVFEYSAIDLLKPRVLLTNGCNGSSQTYRVTKYATQRGIYTVSLHAEGIFNEKNIQFAIVGWNKGKIPTVKKWYMWSQPAYDLAVILYPQFKEVLDVSGSTLYEKYKIFEKGDHSIKDLLKNSFDSIIFYTGWAFDRVEKLFSEGNVEQLSIEGIPYINPDRERHFVIKCLKAVAAKYPNKLLILKYHPATFDKSATEIANHFDEFDNVLILHDEYPIYELIMCADICLNYDSTTVIDAWISDEITMSLCKGGFAKDSGYETLRSGSLVPDDEKQLIDYLDEFFATGEIVKFKDKENIRKKIIYDHIGDLDKKPSTIIAEHVYQSLDKGGAPKRKINYLLFVRGLLNRMFYNYKWLPSVKHFSHMRTHYKPNEFQKQYHDFCPNLKRYYDI